MFTHKFEFARGL